MRAGGTAISIIARSRGPRNFIYSLYGNYSIVCRVLTVFVSARATCASSLPAQQSVHKPTRDCRSMCANCEVQVATNRHRSNAEPTQSTLQEPRYKRGNHHEKCHQIPVAAIGRRLCHACIRILRDLYAYYDDIEQKVQISAASASTARCSKSTGWTGKAGWAPPAVRPAGRSPGNSRLSGP